GTSMSSPAVAGIAALVLEADPTSTPQEVKEALMRTARRDTYTGAIPEGGSTMWGSGKVNAYQAVREVLWMNTVRERSGGDLRIWPNPATSELNISVADHRGAWEVVVTDVTGRVVHMQEALVSGRMTLDASEWASGLYTVQCRAADRIHTATVVKD
ncbi:MAG: T9SS type A sorting domain-containing protein, partial [Flavobacteriales bacterium]